MEHYHHSVGHKFKVNLRYELDMCDYLRLTTEYSGLEQYLKDNFEEKGCVACFERKDGIGCEYSEFTIDREKYEEWIEEIITRNVVIME